jgi:1,4-dihydroxy-2-naphthoate octaprenyltransferase
MTITHIPALKKWVIAVRPFALPASTMPVIFGTAVAVVIGRATFHPLLFVLACIAMVILHSGANLLSDVTDYRKGLDRVPTPASGAIVRGYVSPRSGLFVSLALIAVGCALGGVLVVVAGYQVLIIGGAGILIGVFYTLKPVALKYRGLGDLAVFLDFGILGSLGAWTVQAGSASWIPAVWAVPLALLVVAIVHANNWRDIEGDRSSDVTTVASLLGDGGSLVYYGFLLFGAFGSVALLMALPRLLPALHRRMPLTFLLTFSTLPLAVKLFQTGKRRRDPRMRRAFVALDAGTALLNLLFGLLATAALLLHLAVLRLVP